MKNTEATPPPGVDPDCGPCNGQGYIKGADQHGAFLVPCWACDPERVGEEEYA